jgi:uncharacterized protein YdhG (YjbR/CyaY superfamily)
MPRMMKSYSTVDGFIAGFPPAVQKILVRLRDTIRKSAPEAEETINYGIPTFRLGDNLVHFGCYAKHIGFYPNPSAIAAFKKELKSYKCSKGTVQFPLDQPVPFDLVRRMVKFRVAEVMAKKTIAKKK